MQIALFVSSFDVVRSGWLLNFLKDISATRIKKMQQNLSKVCVLGYVQSFAAETLQKISNETNANAQPLGPEDLVWRMVCTFCFVIFRYA
ncbi:hypothetical protein Ahy_B09g096293 isoform B [Arachis hypogaea]|uniref:Uncharacterized protein n=1 Tax=Arachis hypogaea TaxID=3818 RepID=A0A444XJP6_ARAHY|nr:hypothetical protein Ahy_B09g096293 isoform B [Arachis hypogaea]